jgi:hypothetical protein
MYLRVDFIFSYEISRKFIRKTPSDPPQSLGVTHSLFHLLPITYYTLQYSPKILSAP